MFNSQTILQIGQNSHHRQERWKLPDENYVTSRNPQKRPTGQAAEPEKRRGLRVDFFCFY